MQKRDKLSLFCIKLSLRKRSFSGGLLREIQRFIARNPTVYCEKLNGSFYVKKGHSVPFLHNLTRLLPADIIVNVATPIQAEKGGLTYGRHTYCFFCLSCGKYSLPLYLQMVGQRQFRQPA